MSDATPPGDIEWAAELCNEPHDLLADEECEGCAAILAGIARGRASVCARLVAPDAIAAAAEAIDHAFGADEEYSDERCAQKAVTAALEVAHQPSPPRPGKVSL